jgi:zinc/manganese transport system permease protein
MTDILSFLYLPFLAGLILTGIHAYLGVHVVERGVIFVDLSLAQIAAFGTTVAVLRGIEPHAPQAYWWSLGFTIVGAAIFAMTRVHRETRIPQEAIIGIVYAVSAAAAILAMSKATSETEHLKDMLVGNILSVNLSTVLRTAGLYALVGLFHYIFRKKFLAISLGETIPHMKLWDFLFYVSFGFVVTSSVAIAGVLLVFSYLIVPSVAAMLYARTIGARLAIGWTMGALVSALGILLSFKLDLPTGATIVCTFGIALALMAAMWALRGRRAIA